MDVRNCPLTKHPNHLIKGNNKRNLTTKMKKNPIIIHGINKMSKLEMNVHCNYELNCNYNCKKNK
jgi:hypothetical protein